MPESRNDGNLPTRALGVLSSVLEAIGNTPLVELSRLTLGLPGRILLKLDYLNPGFSKKDRAALQIIEEAERSGALKAGQAVVELTSGNMGTGLAIVCAVKGYRFIAVMSKGNSPERAAMMRALGAEVVLVEQASGSPLGQVSGEDLKLVEARTVQMTRELDAFRADQFVRDGNWRSHAEHTGPEILSQAGRVDAFCDFVGSGGTFRGCMEAFKAANPLTRCYVVEPNGAAVLAGKAVSHPNHRLQGGGYAMDDLRFLQAHKADGYIQVSDEQAINCARRLCCSGGNFRGVLCRRERSRSARAAARRAWRPDDCYCGLRFRTQVSEYGPLELRVRAGQLDHFRLMAGRTFLDNVQPLARRLVSSRAANRNLFLGLLWGWLPCGLVVHAPA